MVVIAAPCRGRTARSYEPRCPVILPWSYCLVVLRSRDPVILPWSYSRGGTAVVVLPWSYCRGHNRSCTEHLAAVVEDVDVGGARPSVADSDWS